MKVHSTRQAAEKLGISFPTLNRYIGDKKIPVPPVTELGTSRVRVWTDADIEKVRAALAKIKNGRKTRYLKQKKRDPKKSKP
jgi:predicted DNA-binding transcriptional regulator AlpA